MPQTDTPTERHLRGPQNAKTLRALRPSTALDTVTIRDLPLFQAEHARELARWPGIRRLEVWAHTTRAALREIVKMPDLEDLYLLNLRARRGTLALPPAPSLKVFRCSFDLRASDLRTLAAQAPLRLLGAQNAGLSNPAIKALAALETLDELDLERTCLDSNLVEILSTSRSISSLLICATQVTAPGLRHVATMTQLRELDVWALDISSADLDILAPLPNLEWISVGGYDGQTKMSAKSILHHLTKFPALKRVWLDGISLTPEMRAAFEERFEKIQVT